MVTTAGMSCPDVPPAGRSTSMRAAHSAAVVVRGVDLDATMIGWSPIA
jgi:hypothetical protein